MRTLMLGLILNAAAAAPDIAGVWKASYTMPDGYKHESTLELRMEGGKLTGKITSNRGTVTIDDGAVDGDRVRFTVIRRGNGDELKVDFTGAVKGETMKLKMQYRDHDPVDLMATRISQGRDK